MSMSLVTSILLCAIAIVVGIALIAYGFRGSRGATKGDKK